MQNEKETYSMSHTGRNFPDVTHLNVAILP